jgi:hypothetical protein
LTDYQVVSSSRFDGRSPFTRCRGSQPEYRLDLQLNPPALSKCTPPLATYHFYRQTSKPLISTSSLGIVESKKSSVREEWRKSQKEMDLVVGESGLSGRAAGNLEGGKETCSSPIRQNGFARMVADIGRNFTQSTMTSRHHIRSHVNVTHEAMIRKETGLPISQPLCCMLCQSEWRMGMYSCPFNQNWDASPNL